eukprot:gene8662-8843_t
MSGSSGCQPDKRAVLLDLQCLMDHGGVGCVVLRHLASTQDRVRICRSVSKECRELVDSQVSSLRVNLKDLVAVSTSASLPLQFPRLRRLAFDRADAADASSLLSQLARNNAQLLSKLELLDLANCPGLEAEALQQLLQACKSLRSLTLPAVAGNVTSTRQDFMEVLSNHGMQLTQLDGAGDYVDASTITHLGQMTSLQHLDLTPGKARVVLTPPALQPLAGLTNLRVLQLGNHLACYDTFALAASLPRLESLSFSYVGDYSVGPLDLQPLVACRTLDSLTLCCVVCSDDLLAVLAKTNISKLGLIAGTFTATPKGLALMHRQLWHFQLRVNDRDLSNLAAALPQLSQLRSLSVSIHRAAEDCRELLTAVFGLKKLRHLALESHYNGVREQELQALGMLHDLRQLSLCNHFNDATLCCLLRSTPQLRRLRLSSCGDISDVGLGCAVGHCRHLRQVQLALVRGVSIAGVAALAAAPCTERVELEGCRNVLAEECRELMRLLNKPHLEVVKLK